MAKREATETEVEATELAAPSADPVADQLARAMQAFEDDDARGQAVVINGRADRHYTYFVPEDYPPKVQASIEKTLRSRGYDPLEADAAEYVPGRPSAQIFWCHQKVWEAYRAQRHIQARGKWEALKKRMNRKTDTVTTRGTITFGTLD